MSIEIISSSANKQCHLHAASCQIKSYQVFQMVFFHKQDMLELRGSCCMLQMPKLPDLCAHAEATRNEDGKEPHDAALKIETAFFR